MMDIREYVQKEREAKEALIAKRRAEAQERTSKLPVYVRAITWGGQGQRGYQIVRGEGFMGEKIALYGYATGQEFRKMDHTEILRTMVLGTDPALQGFIAHHRDGLWLFKTQSDFAAYQRMDALLEESRILFRFVRMTHLLDTATISFGESA